MVPMAFRPGYKLHADLTSSHRNVHRQFLGAEQRAEVAALKAKLGDKLEFKPIGSVNAATAQSLGSVWAYLAAGKGPLASSSYDATLMLRSVEGVCAWVCVDCAVLCLACMLLTGACGIAPHRICRRTGLNDDLGAFPDMQIGFFCGVADLDAISNMNFPPPTALGLDDHDLSPSAQGFTLCPTLLHPRSRGTVTVVSADPFDPPRIDPDCKDPDKVPIFPGPPDIQLARVGPGTTSLFFKRAPPIAAHCPASTLSRRLAHSLALSPSCGRPLL